MHEEQQGQVQYLWRERTFVKGYLVAIFLVLAKFIHNSHMVQGPLPVAPIAGSTPHFYAPGAYRVAIPALIKFLLRMHHFQDPYWVLTFLDFVFGLLASYLLYKVVVAGFPLARTSIKERALTVVLFLAFLQFAIPWVIPWQRPETLPSALFIAAALFCLTKTGKGVVWTVALLAAAAVKGFVRSDVSFAFGAALALASLMGDTLKESGSRWPNLLRGGGVVLISVAEQAYLQLVRFPHLTYEPGSEVMQFRNNLGFHNLSNCTIALLPYLVIGGLLIVKRVHMDAVDAVVAIASVVYFAMWFTVSSVDEVRIYVPFLMALSVVAAKYMGQCILRCQPADAG
jgi:hypothetical protein